MPGGGVVPLEQEAVEAVEPIAPDVADAQVADAQVADVLVAPAYTPGALESFAATNGGSCTASDPAGNYTCTVPQSWSGTVTPALSGYGFTPSSRSYSNVVVNQAAQDYTAAALPTHSIGTYLEVLAAATEGGVLDATVRDLAIDALTHHWTDDDPRWARLAAAS